MFRRKWVFSAIIGIMSFMPLYAIPPTSLMDVRLEVGGTIALGEVATVTCFITSEVNAQNTLSRIVFDRGLSFVKGDTTWSGDIYKGDTISFSLQIKIDSIGVWCIYAQASSAADPSIGDGDAVYLDVKQNKGGQKTFPDIIAERGVGEECSVVSEIQILQCDEGALAGFLLPEDTTSLRDTTTRDATVPYEEPNKGTVTIVGRVVYRHPWDELGVYRPVINACVYAYDKEFGWSTYLGGDITNWNGEFSIGPINNSDGPFQDGLDIWLKIKIWNTKFRVVDIAGDVYYWFTSTHNNVPNGTLNFGNLDIGGNWNAGSVYTFAAMNFGWNLSSWAGHNCEIWAFWPSSDTYESGGVIYISPPNDRSQDVVLHEYAHAMMYSAYDGWWPPNATGPHYINGVSNVNMAWTEGWADFYPIAVDNDGWYDAGGETGPYWRFCIESPSWCANGDACGGRVAGALLDIYDYNNDGYDHYGTWIDEIWDLIWDQNDATFNEFWQAWKSRGYNTHDVVQCIYQNTIDYDTPPTLSGLPNVTLYIGESREDAFDLDDHAYDPESPDYCLNFTIIGNTNPNCGASIDANHRIDIHPVSGWTGYSDVTIQVSDGIKTDTDVFRVTVRSLPCPFLYTYDGSCFVEDNNILAGSGQGEVVEDWYKLMEKPVKDGDRYRLQLREESSEHSFLDKVRLIAIDHP
ncbi:MAG: hypothetical protein U9R01_05175, partial [candidate division WOR-3 bacterium]|nr:hypothetical protein [candidate division WOR-3 bacterium]